MGPRRKPSSVIPRSKIATAIAVVLAVFALQLVAVGAAEATPTATVMATTQRMSGPSLDTTQNGTYARGAVLSLVCYELGESVQGYYSPYIGNGGWDNLWYQVSDGYYVADVDINTGSDNPVTGECSTPTIPQATVMATTQRMSGASLDTTQNGTYAQGSTLTLVCYVHGQSVQGYYSPYIGNGGWDNLWYQVNDGYYVADIDINTGSDNPVTPACSTPSGPQATVMATTQRMSGPSLGTTQNGSYAQGSTLTLSCYEYGEAVEGYYSPYVGGGGWDSLWYQVSDGFFVADIDINTGSNNPVTAACAVSTAAAPPPPPPVSSSSILTRAKSWSDVNVPYSQSRTYTNEYGTYRTDCSGYVSMAWSLGSSYTTQTLPQVAHQIAESDLQPGDILLNDGANSDDRHVVLFSSWANAAHTSYWVYEENPDGAVYHQIPYPYWPGYGTYVPYRKD